MGPARLGEELGAGGSGPPSGLVTLVIHLLAPRTNQQLQLKAMALLIALLLNGSDAERRVRSPGPLPRPSELAMPLGVTVGPGARRECSLSPRVWAASPLRRAVWGWGGTKCAVGGEDGGCLSGLEKTAVRSGEPGRAGCLPGLRVAPPGGERGSQGCCTAGFP